MRYQFGDSCSCRFRSPDQSTTKQRPGVIVSSTVYHDARRGLILMAVTSQLHGGAFGELVVQDWQAAKLVKPSAIKPVLATLEQMLVIKTLGRLSTRDQQRLRETIATLFG
jgi:mRNA interferase MazF